jgi:hypothetical protein
MQVNTVHVRLSIAKSHYVDYRRKFSNSDSVEQKKILKTISKLIILLKKIIVAEFFEVTYIG